MRLFLLTMVAAVAVQGVALAQDNPTPPPPPPPVEYDPYLPPLPRQRISPLEARDVVLRLQSLDAQNRYVNSQPEARRERAARLSAMANGGQCPEAIQIARDEGDADMASRLFAACRTPAS